MTKTNWKNTTNYMDTVGTTLKTFSFNKPQNLVKVTLRGTSNVTYTIGTSSGTLTPGQSVSVYQLISSFNLTASSGTQAIEVYAIEDGDEKEEDNTGVSVYNAAIGLRRWRRSLAKVKTQTNQIANINVIGDSITEGGYSDPTTPQNYLTKGYVGLIRSALSTKYGNVGNGAIPCYYPNANPFWSISNGFTIASTTNGFASRMCSSSTTGTAAIPFNGTGINLFLATGSSLGQFNYNIDGGANTLYDCNQAFDLAHVLSITGLSDANHTLNITKVSDGKQLWLYGHQEIKGTNGVRVNMIGRWGITASSIVPTDCLKLEVDYWNPDLTIISLTANDYGGQTDLATYESQLQTIISRALQFGDVLLTTVGAHSDVVGPIKQQVYFDVVKKLAIQNNCALVDISYRWGGGANANSLGMLYDVVHPNNYGHQDIASAILRVIDEY